MRLRVGVFGEGLLLSDLRLSPSLTASAMQRGFHTVQENHERVWRWTGGHAIAAVPPDPRARLLTVETVMLVPQEQRIAA